MSEVRQIGTAGTTRQGDADVDADGDAGANRIGKMDGVGVGGTRGDGRAYLGEREGLRVGIKDGSGDTASPTDRDRGAGGAGGRRRQRHRVVLAALDIVAQGGRQAEAEVAAGEG